MESQHAALIKLTHSGLWSAGDEKAACREITATAAGALSVERVSIWRFTADRSAILCENLFVRSSGEHVDGMCLRADDFPSYFQALLNHAVLPVDDARHHPHTREFRGSYLEPLGITSMLDAPVFINGILDGVLCFEQVGPVRQWSRAEETFAVAIANLVSLMFAQCARARGDAFLRTILETEPETVMVVDQEGLVVEVNPAGFALLEVRDRKRVVGLPAECFVHPDDRALFREVHEQVVQGENCRREYRVVGAKGEVRWVEAHSVPMPKSGPNASGVLSVVRDVTARKQTEDALLKIAESVSLPLGETYMEDLTAGLIEALRVAGAGVFLLDTDSDKLRARVMQLRGEAHESFCYDVEGTPCEKVLEGRAVFHRRDVQGLYPRDSSLTELGINSYAGVPLVQQDGLILGVVAVFSEKELPDEGLVLSALKIFASRALAELERKKVAEREAHLRALADSLPIIVWTAKPEGTVDFFNGRYFDFTGFGRREGVAGWTSFLHPDDRADYEAEWRDAVSNLKPFSREARLQRGEDGSYRWFRMEATPIFAGGTELVKWYGTALEIHETKSLQEKAVDLAARLSLTLESLTDVFFTLNSDWEITYANLEGERFTGLPRCDLLGKTIWRLYPEMKDTPFHDAYHRAAKERVPLTCEAFYPPMQRWLEVRAFPFRDGLAVFLRDVTELRRSQMGLRESDERFQLLCRATNDIVWDWRLAEGTIWWNESFQKFTGLSTGRSEPTFEDWVSRLHPEDKENVCASLTRSLQGRESSWVCEYRFLAKDAQYAYVLDRGYIMRDVSGKAHRMVGCIIDITERRVAEDKLKEQATLLDEARDAILVFDLAGRVVFWNKSAERIYGWPVSASSGRPAWELLGQTESSFAEMMKLLLARGEWAGEVEHTSRGHDRLIIEGRWTLLRDDAGAPKSILAIHTDISSRKQLETQFLRAQRLDSIGTLAGGIAHDLNNILSPVLLAADLLRADERDAGKSKLLDAIFDNSRRGADLVKRVLAFAKGQGDANQQMINLEATIEDVMSVLRDTFPKNVTIQAKTLGNAWPVLADPTQVHQVLMNLCLNARDAMPEGGALILEVSDVTLAEAYTSAAHPAESGPHVRIAISDTGMGVEPALLDKIFDPFFTTKDVGSGTGLGLATVATIMKTHRGWVNVTSRPGKGSTFEVFFPAFPQLAPIRPESSPSFGATPPGSGKTILVVDDEPGVRTLVEAVLSRAGYVVVLAGDGVEALKIFRKDSSIGAVLTDCAMPVMDGPALMAELKKVNAALPIIAMTGNCDGRTIDRVNAQGVDHILEKPFSPDDLVRALAIALQGTPKSAQLPS